MLMGNKWTDQSDLVLGTSQEGEDLRDPKNPTFAYEPVHRKPSPSQALRGEEERENQEGARSKRGVLHRA